MAKNGKEAIELIEAENPNLILTDIMMDYVIGLEVISHVRNKLKSKITILVFSSSVQEEMVLNAFNLRATDFMSKPLCPRELSIRVRRMFL